MSSSQEEWWPLDALPADLQNPPQAIYEVKVEKKRLCLAYHQNQWYAMDASCPHANGPLAGGKIQDGQVICPWHRFGFDLKTGQSDSGGYYVNTYPVKIKNQRLWVKINPRKRWWKFW